MSLSKNQNLKKSKSLCSLQNDGNNERLRVHRTSESSVELYVMMSDSDDAVEEGKEDSGFEEKVINGEILSCLEQKIDRLSDMFLEQCRLLTTLKEEIRNSKATIKKAENAHNQVFSELMKNVFSQRIKDLDKADASSMKDQSINVRAKTLLDAIESKRGISMDREISNALVNFLQSEELKEQMVRATAESVKEVIGSCVSSDCSTLYLPVLERSHRRLVRHITKVIEEAFIELEENSASLSKSVYKTSKVLRRALERHQSIVEAASDPEKNLISTLQCSVEEFLHKELKQWRQKVLDMFNAQILPTDDIVELATPEDYVNKVTSPPQPADPEHSIIDQLMKSAEIKKQMNDGDVNGSFERALSAADLSLVMAACRAAEPLHVFTPPCQLRQPVLLSLVQQLATDMVHDTILKCSVDNLERESDGSYRSRDHEHYGDSGHNTEFDHEAILGSVKESEEFDRLSPEEAKRRLALMLPKMDLNNDQNIDRIELKKWILNSFVKLSREEAEERMSEADENRDGSVTWSEYLQDAFGVDTEEEVGPEDTGDSGMLLQEEKAMWSVADKNGDGKLNLDEFEVFTNPEEHFEMHEFLVQQALREKDANRDGSVDFSEFIADRGSQQDKAWVVAEKDKFDHELDLNGDGALDAAEVRAWVIPDNEEIADEEVEHLFASADDDHDDVLSFEEVLRHHDVFVGSEASDAARDLLGEHFDDEL